MSGRVAAIDVVESNTDIMLVGAATGGVWKSISGGLQWRPVFEHQHTSSIGAIAINQSNPSMVWVGTGEGNPRNSAGVGYGIYKSLDGGDSWQHLGLEKTEHIHRVVLHPDNADVAFVAASGATWGENPERGVFKTTDGGKTWKKILFVNDRTGCCDLVMDPKNPNKLFAAMWEHRRFPWSFNSGGEGSGIYVSLDGGETWKKITDKDGLPKGALGKSSIAISRSNPDVVYALVEATRSELVRSDDGGKTFRTVNKTLNIAARPFYFCDIRVDPENENRVYNMFTIVTVSTDGGRTFQTAIPYNTVHPDHHALWIHPKDGSFLVNGNDGGIAISYDRAKTWRFVETIPLAQFYHVQVDNELPYNIYGGLQDNGSWRGPSSVWENGGIRNYHWQEVGFGDGFATVPDPKDASVGYAMSQGGNLFRYNTKTGERKNIRPAPTSESVDLRFNWNAAIALDPFDSTSIYYGSQFVHKSTNRGESWRVISPDLTTNDKSKQRQKESGGLSRDVTAAENHCTILTIAPSAIKQGVMWAGTDDGNIYITANGGTSWENLTERIPNVPKATWCPHIEVSKFDAGTAYIVFDDHRRSNWETYVFKVTNFGKSWESLSEKRRPAGLAANAPWGYAHTIEQDPVQRNMLYLGTEFGMFLSYDEGKSWMKFMPAPTAPVTEFAIHPRDHDLIIGTHGRALYVLDDIRPLRAFSSMVSQKPLHLFEPLPCYQHDIKQESYHFSADAMFKGENKPYGATFTYFVGLKDEEKKWNDTAETKYKKRTVSIEILNEYGKVIRKFKGAAEYGFNRATWNLRQDGIRFPTAQEMSAGDDEPQGNEVLPGKYSARVKLEKGKEKFEARTDVEILPDPRQFIAAEDRQAKFMMMASITSKLHIIKEALTRIQKTNKSVDVVLEQLKERKDSASTSLRRDADSLKKTLKTLTEKFIEPQDRQGLFRGDDAAANKLGQVMGSLGSSFDAPTETQRTYLQFAEYNFLRALEKFNQVFSGDVKAFQEKVESMRVSLFPTLETLDATWSPKE
jgi:photosystem II stability/assembly factor-like uncharacterized protein